MAIATTILLPKGRRQTNYGLLILREREGPWLPPSSSFHKEEVKVWSWHSPLLLLQGRRASKLWPSDLEKERGHGCHPHGLPLHERRVEGDHDQYHSALEKWRIVASTLLALRS